jgi:fermentation-respiration switch protein FrsA (DUF1100 family)
MRRLVQSTAAVVALLGLSVVGGARAAERHFLYRTERSRTAEVPASTPLDVLTHELRARDGVVVHTLELEGPSGAPVVVHFHNNSDSAAAAIPIARQLASRGLGVVLVEYRGYGASRGEPTEEGLYLDAEATLDWLAERGVPASRVVLWGTSLGTGVAAEMAHRGRGAALVLVTPYTSIPDLVTAAAPFVPARALVPDRFDTLAKAPEIRVPALVIHGDADEVVPFAMGERVAGAIEGARMLRVPGGHHGDLFAREDERLTDAIASLAFTSSR